MSDERYIIRLKGFKDTEYWGKDPYVKGYTTGGYLRTSEDIYKAKSFKKIETAEKNAEKIKVYLSELHKPEFVEAEIVKIKIVVVV